MDRDTESTREAMKVRTSSERLSGRSAAGRSSRSDGLADAEDRDAGLEEELSELVVVCSPAWLVVRRASLAVRWTFRTEHMFARIARGTDRKRPIPAPQ